MKTSPCASGNTNIASITVLNTLACLDDGTGTFYADVVMKAEIRSTAMTRYDIGLWGALAGGGANMDPGNQCHDGILRPLESQAGYTFNATGGAYRDIDHDYCGDLAQLIPTKLAPGGGATYAYTDTTVKPSAAYYYWFQAVDLNGGIQMFGPDPAQAK